MKKRKELGYRDLIEVKKKEQEDERDKESKIKKEK